MVWVKDVDLCGGPHGPVNSFEHRFAVFQRLEGTEKGLAIERQAVEEAERAALESAAAEERAALARAQEEARAREMDRAKEKASAQDKTDAARAVLAKPVPRDGKLVEQAQMPVSGKDAEAPRPLRSMGGTQIVDMSNPRTVDPRYASASRSLLRWSIVGIL